MFTIRANSRNARRFEALLEMVVLDDGILPQLCELLERHYLEKHNLQSPAKSVA